MKRNLILVVISIIGLAWFARAETPSESPTTAPNAFDGKFISVVLEPTGKVPAYILRDVKVQKIGGREFVVGVGADTKRPKDTGIGLRVGIALDRVTAFFEFTKEEFEAECESECDKAMERKKLIPSLDFDIARPSNESPG